jgi:hypothetical protein
MKRLLGFGVLAAVIAGCSEEPFGNQYSYGDRVQLSVAQGGAGGVYFLPPLYQSTYAGTFAPDREPVVRVCAGAPAAPCAVAVAEFDTVLDEGEPASGVIRVNVEDEHYIVNWKTARVQGEFRIFVLEHGAVQAFIDVSLGGGGPTTLWSEGFRPVPGTLPIIFRMEETEQDGTDASANGLFAEYFDWRDATPDFNVATQIVQRVDPVVDFDTSADPDAFGIGQTDRFMARWTGFIVPEVSSLYTLCVTADNGVRLWLNDYPFIDNWVDQGETTTCASYWMVAGERYPVRLEWYHVSGAATARLTWQSLADDAPYTIPASVLWPD